MRSECRAAAVIQADTLTLSWCAARTTPAWIFRSTVMAILIAGLPRGMKKPYYRSRIAASDRDVPHDRLVVRRNPVAQGPQFEKHPACRAREARATAVFSGASQPLLRAPSQFPQARRYGRGGSGPNFELR